MQQQFVFTSDSVTEGHPDKLCDQVSDAIVDRFVELDPHSSIIAECAVATGIVFVAARFASLATVDIPKVVRQVIHQIGYDQPDFNPKTCSVITSLSELPPESRHCFDEETLSESEIERMTAGNQVTVFGFACRQSPALMPLPIWLAHRLARRLSSVRLQKLVPYLAPDGKTQVAVEYKNGRPLRIPSLTIIASQNEPAHAGGPSLKRLEEDLRELVVTHAFHDEDIRPDGGTQIFVNPDGPVVKGGPSLHAGLTGRKNGIDMYGDYSRQSDAALSGKDVMRIDRIGAYAARYAAKNAVAAGLADECEVQVSYAIGSARPMSIQVETFGTGKLPEERIAGLLRQHFDFRPAGIIKQLHLRSVPASAKGGFFRKLAAYGHVGRMDIGLPWEVTDLADALRG